MDDLKRVQLELDGTLPKTKDPDDEFKLPPAKDYMAYEELRRDLLRRSVMAGIYLSIGFFALICVWILCFAHRADNSWHILLLLIIPPTTLLFAIYKAMQKHETQAKALPSMSSTAFASELAELIQKIVSAFKS